MNFPRKWFTMKGIWSVTSIRLGKNSLQSEHAVFGVNDNYQRQAPI